MLITIQLIGLGFLLQCPAICITSGHGWVLTFIIGRSSAKPMLPLCSFWWNIVIFRIIIAPLLWKYFPKSQSVLYSQVTLKAMFILMLNRTLIFSRFLYVSLKEAVHLQHGHGLKLRHCFCSLVCNKYHSEALMVKQALSMKIFNLSDNPISIPLGSNLSSGIY